MNGIFRYKNNQPVNWYHRSLDKSNQYCLYCGALVGNGSNIESNKEHLIGREFVPAGEFGSGNSFNFIFRACKQCNDEKANIERHLSSIALFSSPARGMSELHNLIAERKAGKDFHPDKKGVLVRDSVDTFNISSGGSGFNMSVEMVGPPQPNPTFVTILAFRHIQGIFSLITSQNPLVAEKTNLLIPKYFHFYGMYNYRDWGNAHLTTVMGRAKEIPCYANIETANGFFKVIMRRSREPRGEWFWALEWNKNFRLVGAITNPATVPAIFRDLPPLTYHNLGVQEGAKTRMREDVPLIGEEDILFRADIEMPESA